MPRSTPITASGRAGAAAARSVCTVKLTCQRPSCHRTVAEAIRAPSVSRRASLRDRLVRFDPAQHRQHHVGVAVQPDRAGGEAHRPGRAAFGLEPGKAHLRALTRALLGVAPVGERVGEAGQPAGVGLLGVARPPRRHLVLDLVPAFAQAVHRPGQGRGELVVGDAVGALGLPLRQIRLHLRQAPVERHPHRPAMRRQHGTLTRGGVQRETVGLHDPHDDPLPAYSRVCANDSTSMTAHWVRLCTRIVTIEGWGRQRRPDTARSRGPLPCPSPAVHQRADHRATPDHHVTARDHARENQMND